MSISRRSRRKRDWKVSSRHSLQRRRVFWTCAMCGTCAGSASLPGVFGEAKRVAAAKALYDVEKGAGGVEALVYRTRAPVFGHGVEPPAAVT
jgi:hypothetical protein